MSTEYFNEIKHIVETCDNFAVLLHRRKDYKIYVEYIYRETQHLPEKSNLAERLYHFLKNGEGEYCQYGNRKKFNSFHKGYWNMCGRATKCRCARENLSSKISKTKNQYSDNRRLEIQEKRRKTTEEKYGVEHISMLDEIKKRKEDTFIERFGVKTSLQDEKTKEKIKETVRGRYGVDYVMQNQTIKEKTRKTQIEKGGAFLEKRKQFAERMIELYDHEHALQVEMFMKSRNDTCIERYGTIHPIRLNHFREKSEKTNLDRYGFTCSFNKTDYQEELTRMMLKKYGVERPSQFHYSEEQLNVLLNPELFLQEYEKYGVYELGKKYNFHYAVIYRRLNKLGIVVKKESIYENYVSSFLDQCGIAYEQNTRTVIKPLELDFHIPSKSIAIEVCGLYWHSENSAGRCKNYHLDKLLRCQEKGIRLITIFSDEIEFKPEIVKLRLLNLLNIRKSSIYGRKTSVIEITPTLASEYFDKVHIQGKTRGSDHFGLILDDKIVGAMSFGKRRVALGSSGDGYELLRFASDNVVGGASKLFKYFLHYRKPKSIISYCDLRWGTGDLYTNLGMDFIHQSAPSYWYTDDYHTRKHRYGFAKHKISDDSNKHLTEWQIMQDRGYDRIWDCGTYLFEYK